MCQTFFVHVVYNLVSVFPVVFHVNDAQKSHNLTYAEEDVMFFEHQLDLFGKLAYVSTYLHRCICAILYLL